jgi:hypothetical protein
MITRAVTVNLLAIVEAYRDATGKSLSQVSKDFYGNATFFAEFAKGTRSLSVNKLDEMLEDFREKWPPGVPWPPIRKVRMGPRSADEADEGVGAPETVA